LEVFVIERTELQSLIAPEAYSLWLKHYFTDGSWICIHQGKGKDKLAIDWGFKDEIDGGLHHNEPATWRWFHALVNDLASGKMRMVLIYDAEMDDYLIDLMEAA
jgi:hypothetical protein